jgi:hypothetical protein
VNVGVRGPAGTGRALAVLVLAVAACNSVQPPDSSPSLAAPPAAKAGPLTCGANQAMSIVNDFSRDAPGVSDIELGTRALEGVRPTDAVVREGDSTKIVRDGHTVWQGQWQEGRRGYLLVYVSQCVNLGIDGW